MTLLSILNRLFVHKDIPNCERDIYLRRWYLIRTPAFAVFLHKFERSDEDRALHDHPWPFIVIPLWRGYYEWSECEICKILTAQTKLPTDSPPCSEPQRKRVWPILGIRKRPATYAHRVELITHKAPIETPEGVMSIPIEQPAWSIFIRFRECREWGFWTSKGWQAWNLWWKEHCE